MTGNRLKLHAGKLRLEVHPEMGGSIAAFDWSNGASVHPVMRDGSSASNVLGAAAFPLVPFVNRIRRGSFTFRGREVRLTPNMAGDPSPLHGQGWLNAWEVDGASNTEALLRYRHRPGEWPWEYEAVQEFRLDEGGLSLRLSCRNRSPEPMPCGLGLHPYFPCSSQTRIDTDVGCAWTIDEQVLPVEQVPAEGRYSLKDRAICGQDLDNGFGEWPGVTEIRNPDQPFDLRLEARAAHYFHIYSPSEGGFFAAEPVTHANAALNAPEEQWPELGLQVLPSGGEMSLEVRFDVIGKRSST